jgi:tetratricopeptide (TPR) repeat protein
VVKPPDDPAQQQRVADLRERLAHLVALRDAGRCASATAEFGSLIDAARALGYRPLLAEALNAAGMLVNTCGEPGQAIDRLREAFATATAAHHDQAAAEAAAVIPPLAANRLGRLDMAREWLQISRAAAERLGSDGSNLLEAWLLNAEALTEDAAHHTDRALDAARRALALKQRLLGPDHPDTLSAAQNIGVILQSARRYPEALEVDQSTRTQVERALGADHPLLAVIENNEGEILNALGRHTEARTVFQSAIAIWRRAGSDPVMLSYGLAGLGASLLGEGRPAEAVDPLEESLASAGDPAALPASVRAERRFALARALWSQPEVRPRALALARQARADFGGDAEAKSAAVVEVDAWIGSHQRVRL